MYIACDKCKYNNFSMCVFYIRGSGNEIDMPCYREKELIKGKDKLVKDSINDVLDKLREEIKAMFPPSGSCIYEEGHEVEHTVCEVLADVLWIIDKYKAESEE